ncbi:MAG: nucleoside hydrolase [Kiritimatiellia bacterium]|jgi:purine nucleosidase
MNEKVLFDTDIGSDIDDALALAYLLKEPRCELLGVTTVTTFPERRAEMCSVLCRHAGRPDIPIHVGASQALMTDYLQKTADQAAAVSGWDHAAFAKDNTAVEFLHRTILAHPGEVTLLAVGPLTNVALLFMTHPEAAARLKRLVLMSGRFGHGGGAEWNVRNDAHAAAVVYGNFFQSRPPLHFSCGLDVTTQCMLTRDEARRKFGDHAVLAPVRDFAEVWFERASHVVFHDPLAAVCVFDPDVCTWRDARVVVSTTPPTNGVTVPFYNEPDLPHKIAEKVDSARFFDRYFSTLAL